MRSASLYMRLPRWEADIFLHAPFSNAARAALTALSTSGASASATWVMTSPVEGLMVGKVLPDALLTHCPLMSSFVALILTVGSNAVVAVALKPPNLVRAEGGCGALPLNYKRRGARTLYREDIVYLGARRSKPDRIR